MVQTIQITRTGTNGRSPVAGSLQPGQLAIEMGTPTRLWAGVPVGNAATQQKLLLSTSPADNPLGTSGYLPLTGGTLSGGLSFGNATVATPTDLSRHLSLYGAPGYGLSITSATLNFVANDTAVVAVTAAGLAMQAGRTLTLAADPTVALHAATKQYVDARAFVDAPSNALSYGRSAQAWVRVPSVFQPGNVNLDLDSISGDVMGFYQITNQTTPGNFPPGAGNTGFLIHGWSSNTAWRTQQFLGAALLAGGLPSFFIRHGSPLSRWFQVITDAGGTLTGLLTLSGAPTANLHAATKLYVDTQDALRLALAGGTMTGSINMSAQQINNLAPLPVAPNGATPMTWVLDQIAAQTLYQGTWNPATNVPPLMTPAPQNAFSWIVSPAPTGGQVVGPGIPGLSGQTVYSGDHVIWNGPLATFQIVRAGDLSYTEAVALFLPFSGGTLTGPLTLAGNAAAALQPVPLQQMNAALAAYLPLAGGVLTGALTLAANALTPLQPVALQQMNTALAGYLPLTGGVLSGGLSFGGAVVAAANDLSRHISLHTAGYGISITGGRLNLVGGSSVFVSGATDLVTINATGLTMNVGAVTLTGNAAANLQAVPLQQMNAAIAAIPLANYLPLIGGQLTGPLQLPTGSATAASLQFGAADNTGFWRSVNSMAINVQGALAFAATPGLSQFYTPVSLLNNRIQQLADPLNPQEAATKNYVDTHGNIVGGPFLPLTGGVLSGNLTLPVLVASGGICPTTFNGNEWVLACDTGTGDKYQNYRVGGWFDVWRGASGQREWWSNNAGVMTLSPTGNLWASGNFSANAISASATLSAAGDSILRNVYVDGNPGIIYRAFSGNWTAFGWNGRVQCWIDGGGAYVELRDTRDYTPNQSVDWGAVPGFNGIYLWGGAYSISAGGTGFTLYTDIGNTGLVMYSPDQTMFYSRYGQLPLHVASDLWLRNYASWMGAIGYQNISDEALKTGIADATGMLGIVRGLRPRWFTRKRKPRQPNDPGRDARTVGQELGLIAQEVREVFPEAVAESDLPEGALPMEGPTVLSYSLTHVLAAALGAIQELAAEVDALKAR